MWTLTCFRKFAALTDAWPQIEQTNLFAASWFKVELKIESLKIESESFPAALGAICRIRPFTRPEIQHGGFYLEISRQMLLNGKQLQDVDANILEESQS